MIGFFPDPYPDEPLYSVCARYQDSVQYPSKSSVARELLGNGNAAAVIGLPWCLDNLIAALPPGHRYTIENLINHQTLLPFYNPFLPVAQKNRLVQDMRGSRGTGLYQRLGFFRAGIQFPAWLRFCPICVEVDEHQFGECYWHRLHQVPGVEVCPTHSVFLENSNVSAQHHLPRCEFVSAERGTKTTTPTELNLKDPGHAAFVRIAHDAAWLLSQHCWDLELKSTHNRYLCLLAESFLDSDTGTLHLSHLLEAFRNHYPRDFLRRVQCEIHQTNHRSWLNQLVQFPPGVQHPLRHLLFIQFCGYTAEEFFKLPPSFKIFGEAPWSCINVVYNNFQLPQVTECFVVYNFIVCDEA